MLPLIDYHKPHDPLCCAHIWQADLAQWHYTSWIILGGGGGGGGRRRCLQDELPDCDIAVPNSVNNTCVHVLRLH